MTTHHLFCLRHFNDIDNIAPAIHFLLERRECRVTILIYSLEYAYRSDPSLKSLEQTFPGRVRIAWIGDFGRYPYAVTGNPRLRRWHYRARRALGGRDLERGIERPGMGGILAGGLASLFSDWGLPRAAVFDQNRTSVIAGLIEALRAAGISRVVSLPVSPWINYNVLRQTDFIRLDAGAFRRKHDYSGFDEMGQVDPYYDRSLTEFFGLLGEKSPLEGRTRVLGSIRFCRQWLDVLAGRNGASARETPASDRRPRVLVLPSHPKNNSFWEEYLRTLDFIAQYERYDFVVKPHTRYGHGHGKLPANLRLESRTPTSALIDWADIVLYWSTSVALEGFQKNKIMVCLNHLNANRSTFAELRAGYVCRSRDDLMRVLHTYPDITGFPDFDPEGGVRLRREVIQGGGDEDVPGRYLAFIEGEGGTRA